MAGRKDFHWSGNSSRTSSPASSIESEIDEEIPEDIEGDNESPQLYSYLEDIPHTTGFLQIDRSTPKSRSQERAQNRLGDNSSDQSGRFSSSSPLSSSNSSDHHKTEEASRAKPATDRDSSSEYSYSWTSSCSLESLSSPDENHETDKDSTNVEAKVRTTYDATTTSKDGLLERDVPSTTTTTTHKLSKDDLLHRDVTSTITTTTHKSSKDGLLEGDVTSTTSTTTHKPTSKHAVMTGGADSKQAPTERAKKVIHESTTSTYFPPKTSTSIPSKRTDIAPLKTASNTKPSKGKEIFDKSNPKGGRNPVSTNVKTSGTRPTAPKLERRAKPPPFFKSKTDISLGTKTYGHKKPVGPRPVKADHSTLNPTYDPKKSVDPLHVRTKLAALKDIYDPKKADRKKALGYTMAAKKDATIRCSLPDLTAGKVVAPKPPATARRSARVTPANPMVTFDIPRSASVQHFPSLENTELYEPKHPNNTCFTDRVCCQFVSSLRLSAYLFDPKGDVCFCVDCHQKRGDHDHYMRGKPEAMYALPVGWTRFGLARTPRAKALQAYENWHRAYHGTKPETVAKILDTDLLAPPGCVVMGGDTVTEQPGHFRDDWKPKGFDTKQVFITPSPVYAEDYAPPVMFQFDGRAYKMRVALAVLVRQGSYNVGPETMGYSSVDRICDGRFHNDTLEWSTKELGSIVFSGLLVKADLMS